MSVLYLFIATKSTAAVSLPTRAVNQTEYNRRIANGFQAHRGGKLTVGDLKLRPNGNAVANHLLCNGAAVSRVAFPELFALLGTSEGAGDGLTTFNLPNYLNTSLAVPATAPVQTITDAGTVGTVPPVTTDPVTEPAIVGPSTGGDVDSGGRPLSPYNELFI